MPQVKKSIVLIDNYDGHQHRPTHTRVHVHTLKAWKPPFENKKITPLSSSQPAIVKQCPTPTPAGHFVIFQGLIKCYSP